MIKTEFDKIYCINYLESPDRRIFMEKQFNELGLDVTFYNALNYNRFFTEDIKQVICKKIIITLMSLVVLIPTIPY